MIERTAACPSQTGYKRRAMTQRIDEVDGTLLTSQTHNRGFESGTVRWLLTMGALRDCEQHQWSVGGGGEGCFLVSNIRQRVRVSFCVDRVSMPIEYERISL